MNKVKNYLSLIKFSHTIFAMPFAMIGFFLGYLRSRGQTGETAIAENTAWPWQLQNVHSREGLLAKLLLVVLCMVFARSAAMAFNRYLDRHFDARNPRTAIREIPRGIISANSALSFTWVSCFLFLISCLLSYWALRSRGLRRMHRLEKIADVIFIIAMIGMVVVCALITYTISVPGR